MKLSGDIDPVGAQICEATDSSLIIQKDNRKYKIVPVHDCISEATWFEASLVE